ncbi:MAG: type I restriction enzyme HsdR N-terminal domain-containing protein [Bacteroidales bacterium]|nr:type I restriction enzyme HsdR N-terminal domain-containing protein [Bacteroidales bacterium]
MFMSGERLIWDPLRKKEVALTPEEKVRQWFIQVLNADGQVPLHMMMSEHPLQLGDKKWRADILVWDRNLHPLMVVECKRPDVELDQKVLDQALRYNMVLGVKYIVVTNGLQTRIAGPGVDGKMCFLSALPKYEEML